MKNLMLRPLALLLIGFSLVACSDRHKEAPVPTRSYAAIARGKVDVVGGLLSIMAPHDGIVQSVSVQVGTQVKSGQLLARLNSKAASAQVAIAQAEVKHAEAAENVLSTGLPELQRLAQRWAAAAAAGAAEKQKAEDARQASQQLAARIEEAKSEIALARCKLELAQVELQTLSLRAPQAGVIVRVTVQPGSSVSSQDRQALFVLRPERSLVVRAEVNESFIRRIRPGMTASVLLDADPQAPVIPAKVERLGQILVQAHLNTDQQEQMSRVVECILQFQQPHDLLIGQNVLVKFHD